MMADNLQTYMRMGNIFGPPKPKTTNIFGPPNPPSGSINLDQPSMVNAFTNPPQFSAESTMELPVTPSRTISGQYPEPPPQPSIWDQFYNSVMNPPQREHMEYPDSTLNVLNAGLKLAAEPSPLAKNRVIVDGQRYQKQKWFEDPETKEKRFVTDVEEPKFMDQVMKAWSAQGTAPTDILNQPYKDAIEDWKMRTEGLKTVAGAEAAAALAAQRHSQIPYNLARPELEQAKIAISRMTAEERIRASQLKTLTDEELEILRQQGRISIADALNARAIRIVEMQQAGATTRTEMAQTGATTRTGMAQTGANQRNAATNAAALQRLREQQDAINKRHAATIAAGGGMSQTQQRVAEQRAVNEIIEELGLSDDAITFDENGFSRINPALSPEDQQLLADALAKKLGRSPQQLGGVPKPPPAPALPQAAPATIPLPPPDTPISPVQQPPARGTPPPGARTGKARVRAPDGQTGTWDYSFGPLPPGYQIIGQ